MITKIWVDDVGDMPDGYDYQSFTADNAIDLMRRGYHFNDMLEISLDHDAGNYTWGGGDYIEILKYLERKCSVDITWRNYIRDNVAFHFHTDNPVGKENMRRIIQKNGWREV